MIVRVDDVHSVRLIAANVQVQYVPNLHHCIATYDKNDELTGGVLFTEFWGGSVQIHVAGFRPNWLSKALLYLSFHYPFDQLKVRKMYAQVPEWNVNSRNFCQRTGFKIEYKAEDVYNRLDGANGMYVLGLRKEDCPWIKMKPPNIEYAQPARTSQVGIPLALMPTTGAMH